MNLSKPDSTLFAGYRAVEKDAQAFVDKHAGKLYALMQTSGYAGWDLYTGDETAGERYTTANDALVDYSNNPDALAEAEAIEARAKLIRKRNLRREFDVLYKTFKEGSIRPDLQKTLNDKGSVLEEQYNNYRVVYNGQTLSNTDANERFKFSTDPAEVKALWEARHAVGAYRGKDNGPSVAERVVEVIKLRNELARSAGYGNFYAMSLALNEVDKAQLDQLMDDVTAVTDEPFAQLQRKIDKVVQERFGVSAEDARLPWFQSLHALGSAPQSGNMMAFLNYDEDAPFKGKDPIPLLEKTAKAMGSSIQDIIDASDLYYDPGRPGKAQHWFCFALDAPHDVRALENVDPELQKAMGYAFSTSLHEVLGHGLDYSQISDELPKLLRDHHAITTESNAMLIEELVNDSVWFEKILGLPKKEAQAIGEQASNASRAQQLVNIRAMLATIDFERSMYELPDDKLTVDRLNDMWWEKQARYLGEKKPEGRNNPDWARVPHYMSEPYYYNYFVGEVRRAQVMDYIKENYGHLLTKRAGAYLRKHRADAGLYKWDEIVERMTGKPLGADALKKELSELKL